MANQFNPFEPETQKSTDQALAKGMTQLGDLLTKIEKQIDSKIDRAKTDLATLAKIPGEQIDADLVEAKNFALTTGPTPESIALPQT